MLYIFDGRQVFLTSDIRRLLELDIMLPSLGWALLEGSYILSWINIIIFPSLDLALGLSNPPLPQIISWALTSPLFRRYN